MSNNSELFSFDELNVGQFFLERRDGEPYHYGVKVSANRFFDLDVDCLCFLDDLNIDRYDKRFMKCDYEVW